MNGKLLLLKVLGLAFVTLAIVNCGSKGGSSSSTPAASTCAAGTVQTGVGCLQSCGTNMVVYNGQCVSSAQVAGGQNISCGTGMIQSQYGCLPQCGTSAVLYQNSCVPAYGNNTGGGTQYPTGGQGDMCSGRCGPGAVETFSGCMPQYSCAPCYGYNNGFCHIGVNAHAYYGY